MSPEAKKELARAILGTQAAREASWHKGEPGQYAGYYSIGYEQAAAKACVDPELVDIVWLMAFKYEEYPLWAKEMLAKYPDTGDGS